MDPVFCERYGLRSARTGRIDLRVGTTSTDQLGELRMSHRQGPEQEAPVEHIRISFDCDTQLVRTPLQFLRQNGVPVSFYCSGAEAFERRQLFAAGAVFVVSRHLVRKRVVPREGRG